MADDKQHSIAEVPVDPTPIVLDVAVEVARLALLSPGEYDRVRKRESTAIGIRLSTLDAMVAEVRAENASPPQAHLNGHARRFVPIPDDVVILDKGAPLATARVIVKAQHMHGNVQKLHHQQAVFMTWTGTHYREYLAEELRSDIYHFLEKAMVYGKDDEPPKLFRPSSRTVSDVLDAMRAACQLANTIQPPSWIGEPVPDLPVAGEIISCQNGLLHLPTGDIYPHSPDFFSLSALDYNYSPDAEPPQHWYEFLNSVWGADEESVDTLQEVFGYLLGTDSDQQKIPLLVGPKRSGKGTIARILTAMVGPSAMVSPTLASLEAPFGIAPLVGKSIALIADARLGGKADQQRIAERLLSISGEDIQTVERKHIDAWTGKLPTRFFIMSNELPRIADASGALGSRFLVLTMTRSFFGQEDHEMTNRLMGELPSILNWAIEGWRRLRERGFFVPPKSSAEAIQELEDLGSPIGAFVRETCVVDQGRNVSAAGLFAKWESWCKEQGRDHKGTRQSFGRDLRAAVPGLRVKNAGSDGDRERHYEGIGLIKVTDNTGKDPFSMA